MEQVTTETTHLNGSGNGLAVQDKSAAVQKAEYRPAPLVPTNLDEAWRLAKALASSSLVPEHYRGSPENVIAALFMANDLGLSVTQAMREIYVVEGRPASSALLKVALVKQSPLCERWDLIESTDTRATFETKRRNEKPVRHTYSIDDAKVAGLYPGSDRSNWRKRPKLMLRRRCESELADEVYPDVVKGLRTEDEVADMQQEREATRVFAPVVAANPGPQPQPQVVDVTPTPSQTPATTPTQQPAAEQAPAPQAPPARDPVDALLEEIGLAKTTGDVDAAATKARAILPKEHPKRQAVGEAINAARKRVH